MKLFESEQKIMKVLWSQGDLRAREIAGILKESIGWNPNTTYTVIKKCIAKGAIERIEPDFLCHALVSREEIQEAETEDFINKIYEGSVGLLFAFLLKKNKLSKEEISQLQELIKKAE